MQTGGIGKLFTFLLGLRINKHFKEIINFCLFQQFPDSASDNKPAELNCLDTELLILVFFNNL